MVVVGIFVVCVLLRPSLQLCVCLWAGLSRPDFRLLVLVIIPAMCWLDAALALALAAGLAEGKCNAALAAKRNGIGGGVAALAAAAALIAVAAAAAAAAAAILPLRRVADSCRHAVEERSYSWHLSVSLGQLLYNT